MTGPVQLAAAWGVTLTTLAACGSTPWVAPTPRPAPPTPVAEFDHAASLVRGVATSMRPITVSGADAAVELIGPDQGIVYARRGAVNFQVIVGRGKGADPTAEERIAAIVLTHLR